MSCKCSPNCAVTGSVLVTVNAASVADAEALAKSLPNFTYDDPPGAFDIGGGQYMFSGHASAPLNHGSIVSVCPNGQVHAIGTGTV